MEDKGQSGLASVITSCLLQIWFRHFTKHETIENVEVDLHSHYSRVKVLDGEQFI